MPVEWGIGYVACYGYAALSDIRHRRIPNRTIVALLILYGFLCCLHEPSKNHCSPYFWGTFAAITFLGIAFQSVLGAGDSKLILVSLLITGEPRILLTIGLFGGAVSITCWLIGKMTTRNTDVPYGVAISAAALLHLWELHGL
ncbi:prepilin peptidase [Vibrio amylolyticus]|uniref:prepilin peptidase n=1 Tax=Vibrio amylolyticus TaxID=2847292 RepID=UPI00354B68A6